MKKRKVLNIFCDKNKWFIETIESSLGIDQRNHPLRSNITHFKGADLSDMTRGDVVRCDGLPFVSRPNKSNRNKTNNYPGYSIVKLESGYWVLRPTINIKSKKAI